ncbi:hypothetical protein BRADI_2g36259v3 [Brachypodium distachyon]|uniref:Uncharacterized protein n=1 Tax=Brachypodium distachyon TaxID=15368 RepID=A0A2K2DC55_BRADI|nr:hypothetical protein BRADI_2g36259v3 [Brachypodium distachyon]
MPSTLTMPVARLHLAAADGGGQGEAVRPVPPLDGAAASSDRRPGARQRRDGKRRLAADRVDQRDVASGADPKVVAQAEQAVAGAHEPHVFAVPRGGGAAILMIIIPLHPPELPCAGWRR